MQTEMVDRPVCDICYETFLSDTPKRQSRMLPCGHTFCLGCLQGLLRARPQELHCPTCRVPVSVVDPAALFALPRVYIVESSLPGALDGGPSSPTAGDTRSCDGPPCENDACVRQAALFCKNCNSALCPKCDGKMHNINSVMKKHMRVELAQRPLLCSDHNEAVHFYCDKDQALVCSECLKPGAKHGGHIAKHVDEFAELEREQIARQTAVLDHEAQRIASDEAAIDRERQALADTGKLCNDEILSLEAGMLADLKTLFAWLRTDASRELAERDERLAEDLARLQAVREEIALGRGLAEQARQCNGIELVQQAARQRLDDLTGRAKAAGWRAGKRGHMGLELDGVYQLAKSLASLAVSRPPVVKQAKVGWCRG